MEGRDTAARKWVMTLITGIVLFGLLFSARAAPGAQMERGRVLYQQNCAVCHGEEGKGDGLAEPFLFPKPRDLTAGKFKIRSTPTGQLPTDEDLLKVITDGVPGTSMPSWKSIPEKDRRALVDLLKSLDERFKTWPRKPIPIGAPPARTPQLIAKGKQVYRDVECDKCHGARGRGDGPAAKELTDDWDQPTLPYDFTKPGRYKGGSSARDIYRTFATGMAGTPMPSYEDSLDEEQRWAVAYYVQSLSRGPVGPAPKEEATIISKFITGEVPALDPTNSAWKKAPATDLLLRPLWFREGYIDRVKVRSLHNGKEIVLLLEWKDPTRDFENKGLEAFRDAAAVQFPIRADGVPPFLMGKGGEEVVIWQWQAGRPAENLEAAGFGTITTQISQNVKGKGIWKDGIWRVTFSRVMVSAEELVEFTSGKVMPVAFAVWNGAISQVDGEKSVSTWSFLKREVPRQ